MNKKLIFLLICTTLNSVAAVRILLTAALTDIQFDFRKQQYLDSFAAFSRYGIGPSDLYVVESLKKQGPTFLEEYSDHVFYTQVNNPHLRNHGINEAKAVLDAIQHFNFAPDDMIIKLTGRHQFVTDHFLKTVQDNLDYDAIVRLVYNGNIVTVAFAMKTRHLIELSMSLDYGFMESSFVSLEQVMGKYIVAKHNQGALKVLFVEKLDMHAQVYGSTTSPGCNPELIIW